MDKLEKAFKNIIESNNLTDLKKRLGKGGFGLVREVSYKGKAYAAKLIKKEDDEENDESKIILEFRGPGIVKVNKIIDKNVDGESYHLILMEKAPLRSLKEFNYQLHNKNALKLLFRSPFEVVGDNLLRFYVKQIVKGLELLDRSNFSHFDIKPQNILTFIGINLKLTDFGLLRNPEKNKTNDNKFRIPGGTHGYLTPEFYQNKALVNLEDAKKQDYFALGATIYQLKYGEEMLNYKEYNDNLMTSDLIIDLIQKSIDEIKSKKLSDKEFIDFLCSLIQYRPNERPDFEKIYRNKWLNKNAEEIEEISENNELDEKKLLMEMNKSDFLIEKSIYFNNKKNNNNIIIKDENNNNNNKSENKNINKKKIINKGNRPKFIFKDGTKYY